MFPPCVQIWTSISPAVFPFTSAAVVSHSNLNFIKETRREDCTQMAPPCAPLSVCERVRTCDLERHSPATPSALKHKALSLMAPSHSLTELLTLMDIQNNAFDVFVHTCNQSSLKTGSQLAFSTWLQLRSGFDNKPSTQQHHQSRLRYRPAYPSRHN